MHGTGKPLGRWTSDVPDDARACARDVARVLDAAQRVLVLGHAGADGDVAGSSLALAQALRERGKTVTVYNEQPYQDVHAWLVGGDSVVNEIDADAHFDATVVVDAADPDRCGAHFPDAERRGVFVWMDHHQIDEPPGDLNYVDLTAAAVGEMVAEVLDALEHEISKETAKALYCSLMSDTGGFRYGNTSARALRLAGRLVAAGVDPWEMTERLYESQEEERVRLLGRALSTLWRSECGRVGIVTVTEDDMDATGATPEHVHGIVNHVRGVRGVEVAILLRELRDRTKVVVRSRGNVSVGRIAELLGHRGSSRSASFVVEHTVAEARERVAAAAREIVNDTLPVAPAETLADVPVPEPRRSRRKGRRDKRPRPRAAVR
jgi:phosphoesterase RecJ-like protein